MDPRPLSQDTGFPDPPRAVTFTAAFGRKAVFGVVGCGLLAAAMILVATQVGSGAGAPFGDWALDSECSITNGEVLALTPIEPGAERGGIARIDFRYRVGNVPYERACHTRAAHTFVGLLHRVEFLATEPGVSRLLGATRAVPPAIPWNVAVLMAGVGVLSLMVWLRFSITQRQLLRDGRLVPGEVTKTRPIAMLSPRQLAVEFTYRDAQSLLRTGRQWCPVGSALGLALQAGQSAVYVVHDRAHPERCSLASPHHFEPAHGTG